MNRNIINFTSAAIKQIRLILNQTNSNAVFFNIKSGGCNGFEYRLKPINEKIDKTGKEYEVVNIDDVDICVCNKSVLYTLGTTVDWKEDIMGQTFTFDNPMAGNSCGCGSSFNPK